MKNFSKNNYSGKNKKNHKKNDDFDFYPRNNNSPNINSKFLNNSDKNIDLNNFKESDKKKTNFSSFNKRKPKNKSHIEVPKKALIFIKSNQIKEILMIGYGETFSLWSPYNGRAINRIWCTSEIFSSEKFYILLKDLKSRGVLIEEVSWNRLSQLTFGASHQGIALQLASSKTISWKINRLFKKSANPIILALDGITDPHNVGAIIRSAEAFDCKGIIMPQRRSAGLTGTVAKVAAGALEHLPVSRVVNLNRALEELKKNGFLVIGLSGDGQFSILNFEEKAP